MIDEIGDGVVLYKGDDIVTITYNCEKKLLLSLII